ncbi:hypothetical protein J1N35_011670 [Gossypium stocksii]|uniref:Uncharacterized protein n=1 Tax=Gossypium stocksii TaxID=47602 RepID=A0A9D3W375_9ROSI|nr:hypothetical protein J1N35_011670 [Gossypium stocksii]
MSADWGAVCGDLLSAALNTIYGGRIKMAWIRKNFVELDKDSTKVQIERYARCTSFRSSGVELCAESRGITYRALRYTISIRPTIENRDIDDLHPIDLRRPDENWSVFHSQHINMWNNRYDFLPTHEPIIILELAYDPEYMSWFRIHGKPYLYWEKSYVRLDCRSSILDVLHARAISFLDDADTDADADVDDDV